MLRRIQRLARLQVLLLEQLPLLLFVVTQRTEQRQAVSGRKVIRQLAHLGEGALLACRSIHQGRELVLIELYGCRLIVASDLSLVVHRSDRLALLLR